MIATDSCVFPHSVAGVVNCFGCNILNNKLSGGVSGFRCRTVPNIEAVKR